MKKRLFCHWFAFIWNENLHAQRSEMTTDQAHIIKKKTRFWIQKASRKAERFSKRRGVLDVIASSGIWHLSACSQIFQHQEVLSCQPRDDKGKYSVTAKKCHWTPNSLFWWLHNTSYHIHQSVVLEFWSVLSRFLKIYKSVQSLLHTFTLKSPPNPTKP